MYITLKQLNKSNNVKSERNSNLNICILTMKAPYKNAADDTVIFFYFYHSEKIRFDDSCESSA